MKVDYFHIAETSSQDVGEMSYPMLCRWCGCTHDAALVEVQQRYLDCSVWRCPNCQTLVDDRPRELGGSAFRVAKR